MARRTAAQVRNVAFHNIATLHTVSRLSDDDRQHAAAVDDAQERDA